MTTDLADVTVRKVVSHCWQGLLLPCAPIPYPNQCKSLDTACNLFLVLKVACSEEKKLHDSRIQRGLHDYVDGNVHKVVGRLLTDTIPAVIWDRNKTVTSSAVWQGDFAYPMPPRTPLPCTLYTNMLKCTLYTLTGPVKLSKDSVSYLNAHFCK